ncbi:uncharacterized protein A1O9_11745 [Exophiala aquamarina CBS 119918]|uniref:Uncharacterized protein n=1 Tax=Exophiala aquamarina CBS 119918 TaxID=1182545 RepID=A0A072NW55_9EURO|nr:uncharacterized protein A1O9_11745 [Exophiala aquamarina CBS 119918]KEF52119.1 hypothetical protein A1O9_11745 [Exophiala aquamarina CBS 119918]
MSRSWVLRRMKIRVSGRWTRRKEVKNLPIHTTLSLMGSGELTSGNS